MNDAKKTKEQLIVELNQIRQRNAELESLHIDHNKMLQPFIKPEQNYTYLVEISPDMICTVDMEGNFLSTNRACERHLGYSNKEIKEINAFTLVHPDDLPLITQKFASLMGGKNVENLEHRYRTRNGSYITVISNATAISNSKGKVVAALCITRNITKRKKAEQELELRARLLDSATDSIFLHDTDGNILYANEMTYRSRGYNRKELMKLNLRKLIAPELRMLFQQRTQKIIENGSAVFKSAHIRKDGSIIPLEVHARRIELDNRKLVLNVNRDITKQKKAEKQLLEYHNRLEEMVQERTIELRKATESLQQELKSRKKAEEELKLRAELLDSAIDSILLHDSDGKLIYANKMAYESHGYSKDEFMKKNLRELVIPERLMLIDKVMRSIKQKDHITFESAHLRKDSSIIPLEVNVRIVNVGSKKYWLAVNRDITERKKWEETRISQVKALARAEELQQSRQRIIEIQESLRKEIAQQLHGTVQNKLIVLLHNLKSLEKTTPMKGQAIQIRYIHKRLEELLDKDMRFLSHRLYPSILRQGIVPALQSLVDHYEILLHIEFELDKNLVKQEKVNRRLISEQTRLSAYRIAEEALTNIVKHADSSIVKLELKQYPAGWIHLSVTDDGKGFNTEHSINGLGTLMMQDYAEVVNGKYTILSTEGEGTKVITTLPFKVSKK